VTRFLRRDHASTWDKVQDWGGEGSYGTHAEIFCELLMARMMICATARITGSEEWRKIGKKV